MTRLVVFDLDGTLVDSARQITAAMRAGFAATGRDAPDDGSILSIVGLSLPLAVARLTPGIGEPERDRIVGAYRTAFLSDPEAPPLYPGVAETLGVLSGQAALSLAVATGKARRGLVRVLDQHGLRPLFGSLHGGDEYPSKPDPAMLHAAMAEAGAAPGRTVMVGDSVFDIEMARAADVRALGVSWGYYAPNALRAAGATLIIERFSDLPDVVRATLGDAA